MSAHRSAKDKTRRSHEGFFSKLIDTFQVRANNELFYSFQRFVNSSDLIRVLVFLPNCLKNPFSQITRDLIPYKNNMHSGDSASFPSLATRHHQPLLRLTRPLLGASTLDQYLASIPLTRRIQGLCRCLPHSLWPCRWHLSLFRIIIIINHFTHNQISYFLLLPDPKLTQVLHLPRQPDRRFLCLLQLNPTTSQIFQFQVDNLHHLRNLADNVAQAWRKLVNNVHE